MTTDAFKIYTYTNKVKKGCDRLIQHKYETEFTWTTFYMEFADQLLQYKHHRKDLLILLEDVYAALKINYPFAEKGEPIDDICPFTVFGSFNKGITNNNRIKLANAIGKKIGVKAQIPTDFDGIPVLNNMSAWFFGYENDRSTSDISNLWSLFEVAISYANEETEELRDQFIHIFDIVLSQYGVKWNLTMGLFWIRPFTYLNLDGVNRTYILEHALFSNSIQITNLKTPPNGETYLKLLHYVQENLKSDDANVNTFPALSYAAWTDAENESHSEDKKEIKGKLKYWIYSPGPNASMWDEFSEAGIMGLQWDALGDLKQYPSKEDMKQQMKKLYGEQYTYINAGHATWQFSNEINIGDVVFVKKGQRLIIGYGIITSTYMFDDTRDEYKHILQVDWTDTGELPHPGQAVNKALTDITSYTDYVKNLNDLVTEKSDYEQEDFEVTYDTYTKDDFLDQVFMNEASYKDLVTILHHKKNLILQGAPGVGKTFLAKRLVYSMMGEKDDSRVNMIQFHQSYSYEDFMMGFRPTETGFTLSDGPFYTFCKKAEMDSERDYFFIIDEINRGNVSQIFGELLMLIENDKRGQELRLIYKDELFSIPANVYIIGMMNTADRSLAIIDYALRRRFSFYTIKPAFDSNGFQRMLKQSKNTTLDKLVAIVQALNHAIANDESLGEGFQIGHSYFVTDEPIDDATLSLIVNYELIPLLEEYWFDELEKVNEWAFKLRDVIHD